MTARTNAASGRFDIVGVGALNVDVVVDVAGSGLRVQDDETAVEPDEMDSLLARVASLPRRVVLGGSAFNAVTAVARSRAGLRLGYVGVAGEVPYGAQGFRTHLRALGIDASAVAASAELSGVCLALEAHDRRSLRIAPGANEVMADHLDRPEVADHLAGARVLHVTSFLDRRTPHALADVAARLRARAARPLMCLDPGHDWCASPDAAVRRLVAAADLLLLNTREFAALRRAVDLSAATVVVKHTGYAVVHRTGTARRVDGVLPPLAPAGILHPTGAGDAFAAGLLGALAREQDPGAGYLRDLTAQVRAGLAAARAHLLGGRHSAERTR